MLNLLAHDLKFSTRELEDLTDGTIVKHSLDARAPGEVAFVGAVRIRASEDAFVERVRDVVRFKTGPDVLRRGRFSNPPVLWRGRAQGRRSGKVAIKRDSPY